MASFVTAAAEDYETLEMVPEGNMKAKRSVKEGFNQDVWKDYGQTRSTVQQQQCSSVQTEPEQETEVWKYLELT